MKDKYIQFVESAIEKAENNISNLHPDILEIYGFCVSKIRHLINNLVSNFPRQNYLEIGAFTGATTISAGYKNAANIITIDNFSFDDDKLSYEEKCKIPNFVWDIKGTFKANTSKWLEKFTLIEEDCFKVDIPSFRNIYGTVPIYFYDGNHNTKDQTMAYTYFNPILEHCFITIIDDWRWKRVRNGTFKAFDQLNYKIVKHWELEAKHFYDTKRWGNGLFVAVIEKELS